MAIERSELSSISSTLAQLRTRVTALGDAASTRREERTAGELFAVERALVSAARRLDRLLASLD